MFSSPQAFRYQWLTFAFLRLALLFLLPAAALFRFGDFQHYYNLAAWSLPGHCLVGPAPCWPLLDYWYEFPPVFPYLSILILRLVGGGGLPAFEPYAYTLALVLVAADAGTLAVYQALARRLLPARAAVSAGWFYVLMPAPLVLSWWTFDGLTTFWMMLALWALIEQRAALAAGAIGLGALTKILPVLLLPAAWRALPPRRAAWVTAGAAGIFVAGLLPFALRAPAVVAASLEAQASKSSYATIWALLDGNLATETGEPITGNFGPLIEHFDLARATVQLHNPARVPGWVSLGLAGAAYGAVWLGALRRRPPGSWTLRDTLVLVAFTWAIFVLWSKGWSPQWQQMLVPLILLVYPDARGVLLALLLGGVSFVEWPVLLSRGLAWGYWLTVPLRTALIAGWAVALARELLAPATGASPT
jgi:hypothetical protein